MFLIISLILIFSMAKKREAVKQKDTFQKISHWEVIIWSAWGAWPVYCLTAGSLDLADKRRNEQI